MVKKIEPIESTRHLEFAKQGGDMALKINLLASSQREIVGAR